MSLTQTKKIACLLLLLSLISLTILSSAHAQEAPIESPISDSSLLNDEIVDLKKKVISLNKTLFILEEDLLFPSNTQLTIFVSMHDTTLFSLDAIKILIDDKLVSSHLYTDKEIDVLKRGGVQKIYIGNIVNGEHEIVALYSGKGPHQRDFKRGSVIKIDKSEDPLFVEFKIQDNDSKQQAQFSVRSWE